jgi:hypothetical protein
MGGRVGGGIRVQGVFPREEGMGGTVEQNLAVERTEGCGREFGGAAATMENLDVSNDTVAGAEHLPERERLAHVDRPGRLGANDSGKQAGSEHAWHHRLGVAVAGAPMQRVRVATGANERKNICLRERHRSSERICCGHRCSCAFDFLQLTERSDRLCGQTLKAGA